MHIHGIGTDIVSLERVRGVSYLDRVAEYILLPEEFKVFMGHIDKVSYLASRFALKEAVIKAFPTKIGPRDFKIVKNGVKPEISFIDKTHDTYSVSVSMSHEFDYAVGFALVW